MSEVRAVPKMSYPTSEVRVVAGRSYPMPKVRVAAQTSYTHPRSGEAVKRRNPTSKEWRLRGRGGPRGATPIQGQEGWP